MNVEYNDEIKLLLFEDNTNSIPIYDTIHSDGSVPWTNITRTYDFKSTLRKVMDSCFDVIVLNTKEYKKFYNSLNNFKMVNGNSVIIVFGDDNEVFFDNDELHYYFCSKLLSEKSLTHYFKQFILTVLHQRKLKLENEAMMYLLQTMTSGMAVVDKTYDPQKKHDILKKLHIVKSDLKSVRKPR